MEIGLGKYSEGDGELEEWIDFESNKLSKQRVLEVYNNIATLYKRKLGRNIKRYKNGRTRKVMKINPDSPFVVLKLNNDNEIIEEYRITERFYRQIRYYLATGKTIGKK